MSASSYTWPFNLFAPGNLNQPILPGWSFAGVNVNYAGNAGIERDVVEKIASFGRQIGVITDVVLERVKTNGMDLVFDKSGLSTNYVPVVLYSKDSADFTTDIITALNKKAASAPEKPAAAATSPASSPAKPPAKP